ncbi:MAG: AmmeMemoRadiSam system protein B [Candidatus Marinimicrobia bacterium]|nr:AmmeMemoRadiSam system protein B [Candidatus Neomarinimicrobiota bacterium]
MSTRKPAVAGTFYPGEATKLKKDIQKYLSAVPALDEFANIAGIISPHAGYIFSGPVAATAFKAIAHLKPKTVIVFSPSHQEYFQKYSIYPGDSYTTPLGELKINDDLRSKLLNNPHVIQSTAGHKAEHALEVQLPFLQEIFSHRFEIVPVVIGDVTIEMMDSVAGALANLNLTEDFLVIASSDLSHFHSYELANTIDRELLDLLQSYNLDEIAAGIDDHTLEACGIMPIYTLMKYTAERSKAVCKILDYRNSGDTAGDKYRVVGYAAGIVYNP